MTKHLIEEHSEVVLLIDQPGFEAGAVGLVIHIHPNAAAYHVEFPNDQALTLTPDQVRPLRADEVTHVKL